jgi:Putative Ig domain
MHSRMTSILLVMAAALAAATLAGTGTVSTAGAAAGAGAASRSATGDTPPVFVQATPPTTGAAGQDYRYAFAASGTPAPTYTLTTGSWAWLHINTSAGEVSGTVPAGITSFKYTVTAANTAGTATAGPFTIQVTGTAGPYVTLLFSRTEMTAADDCVANGQGIATLAPMVAPYLKSLGLSATGTLQTGPTREGIRFCTHFRDSLAASWADAANLATSFGWSFGSHTATYPSNLANLTPEQSYAETCGSAATIDAHGLPGGHGIIAYPGSQSAPVNLQTNYAAKCFAWGRKYTSTGITWSAAGSTPPYWQYTEGLDGGACNTATAPCYTITSTTSRHYSLPGAIITRVKALKPGQWFTLQAFILVTGTNPPYSRNATKWDCTSSDPKLHWANDNERYCYSDWRQIISAITAVPHVIVTDPLSAGVAFGRPASYPLP